MSHTGKYKTIVFMLIVSLLAFLLPAVAAASGAGWQDTSVTPPVTWSYVDKGSTIEVNGCIFAIGSPTYDTLTIPSAINGEPVTSIVHVFNMASNFQHLVIPASVTNIGDNAVYYCPNVQSITIQGSVTNIGQAAFRGCLALETISIPGTVKTIGELAFADCSSLSGAVTIPAGVSVLNEDVFSGCSAITGVTLNEGLTTISGSAFQDCTGLTSVALPASLTGMSLGAFYGCNNLTSFTVSSGSATFSSQDGVLYDKAKTKSYSCPQGKAGAVALPTGLTTVGGMSFSGCVKLTGVTIPGSVTSVEAMAFAGCSGISALTLPAEVKTIGIGAFMGCSGLTSLVLPAATTSIGDGAFIDCSGITGFTLPDGVTTVGARMFSGCTGLASVTLPDSISSIGDSAFEGCTSLGKCIFKGDVPVIAATAYPTQGFTAYYNVGHAASWASYTAQPKQPYAWMTVDLQNGSAAATTLCDVKNGHVASPATPTRTGYTFGGWYRQAACTSAWNFATDTITGDITAYAKWTAKSYSVTFDSQGGSVVLSKTALYNTLIIAPAAPTRTGYTFGGWYKQAACATAWNFKTDKVTTATTLFAKWTVNQYTVSVATGSASYGTVSGGGSYAYGASVTVKAMPKAGYRFVRWLEGSNQISTGAEYKFTVSKARALKAEFAKIAVPGSFKASSTGYNSVTLTWTAVTGAKEYEVYRAASIGGTYSKIATTASASYTNAGLTAGAMYYYKVRAKCVAGSVTTYGGYSAIVSAKPVPGAPGGAKAARVTDASIKVSWSVVSGASGYEVYRSGSKAGTYTLAGSVAKGSLVSYTNTKLADKKTYYYEVRAYILVGSVKVYGAFSVIVSATT